MRVRIMEGSGVGGASALKMCYGGIDKARQRPCYSYGALYVKDLPSEMSVRRPCLYDSV